jgi:hypothetical protein
MTNFGKVSRGLAMWAGAVVVLAWAVATALAYLRSRRPVTATRWQIQGADPYSVTLAGWVN